MSRPRILKPGRNCWRIRRAERVTFLIDGQDYFHALYSAIPQAEHEILISSWDIYSGIRLGALQKDNSTLESLREKATTRSLMPLDEVLPQHEESMLTNVQLVDPEQPINPETLLYHYLPDSQPARPGKRIFGWLFAIVLLSGVAALWRFTGLGDWLEVDRFVDIIESLRENPLSIPLQAHHIFACGISPWGRFWG